MSSLDDRFGVMADQSTPISNCYAVFDREGPARGTDTRVLRGELSREDAVIIANRLNKELPGLQKRM